ncbi:MAG: iron-sulfur cluster assembly scaffold protein, partial [Patescibacteria group bacterium]
MPDVTSFDKKQSWFYTDIVREHFFHPQNFLDHDPAEDEFNAIGKVGSPACGDELRVWMLVDAESQRIKNFSWRT